MNENRYNVTASLFMLKDIKRRQEHVQKGYQLLRRKIDGLRLRGRQAASELSNTQVLLGHALREAYISLAAVKFTNGESNAMVLESIGEAQIRVERTAENISGVATVSLQALEDTGASDTLRFAGLGAGGHRTSEAKRSFRKVVRILIKFASLRNTCVLLDDAIKTTLRKVNGIEKVILPKLRNTESYILMEMDEREREEFHRLKMVKAKKIKNQALAALRKENSKLGAGENSDFLLKQQSIPTRIRSSEYLTNILYACSSALSSTTDSGDYKYRPTSYPHHWDDEDLLF